LPFLPLFGPVSGASSTRLPNSSGFAAHGNVTVRVLSGKSGKKRQRRGNDVATDGTVGGKNGKVLGGCWPYARGYKSGCDGIRVASLPRYAVVQDVGGAECATHIELKYHK
jgi:hypothetical protein